MLRPAKLDKRLARELKGLADAEDPYDTVTGKTMCTNDFYEGQGRLDGAFCDYGEQEKMEYLNKLADFGEKLLIDWEVKYLTYFICHPFRRGQHRDGELHVCRADLSGGHSGCDRVRDPAGPVEGWPSDDAQGGDDGVAESSAGARVAPHPQAYEHPRQAEAAAEHAVGYSVA